jgi:hypothetical protein
MKPKGQKPKYVIFCPQSQRPSEFGPSPSGYYSAPNPYRLQPRENASLLTHKEANVIEGKLRRLGYKGATMQPA